MSIYFMLNWVEVFLLINLIKSYHNLICILKFHCFDLNHG